MKYQTVFNMALAAYTLDECVAAEAAISEWLAAHPDDLGLHEIAGQLGIVKSAAIEREGNDQKAQHVTPPLAATAHRSGPPLRNAPPGR